jgi:hypothetical protein
LKEDAVIVFIHVPGASITDNIKRSPASTQRKAWKKDKEANVLAKPFGDAWEYAFIKLGINSGGDA